jgi:nucleotide-binding universal stress UspA family protein
MPTKILVATDGRSGALGALHVARLLAERSGAGVEVIAVFESTNPYAVGSPLGIASLPPHYVRAAIDALRSRVRTQLTEIGTGPADWPVSVEMGSVAATIARAAAKQAPRLIVLGLRRPGALERWLARETLLRLIHLAPAPVLAVPENVGELPRRVVLAVDFSDFSRRAAREVIDTVAPDGRLHLAHVTWIPTWEEGKTRGPEWTEWEETYRAGVERRLEEFAAELGCPASCEVETHLLTGDPGSEILRLAEEVDADLIAAGSHGAGFFGRIVLGSVSGKLVHGAHCSLLIAPPQTIPAELGLEDLSERDLLQNLGRAGALAFSDSSPPA